MRIRVCILISGIALLLLNSTPAAFAAKDDLVVTRQDYYPGDYFVYTGYTPLLVERIMAENAGDPDFDSLELADSDEMRMTIHPEKKCTIGGFDGECHRGTLQHMVNLTLHFKPDTTDFKDDQMMLEMITSEETLTPTSSSAWRRTTRTVTLTSWFSTEAGDEQSVEQRISEVITSSLSGEQPAQISVGDFWLVLESRSVERTASQRENKGLWMKVESNQTMLLQRQYIVVEESQLSTPAGFERALRVDEMIAGSENRSTVHLSKLGYPLRIEEYMGEELVLNASLSDFRYLKAPDPSARQSIQWGGICFAAFFVTSALFLVSVSLWEWRDKRRVEVETRDFSGLDARLEHFRSRRDRRTTREPRQRSKPAIRRKLVDFYQIHNPAKLTRIDEMISRMEEQGFGDGDEFLAALNDSLRARYGADLDNSQPDAQLSDEQAVTLPESSQKLQAYIDDLLSDEL